MYSTYSYYFSSINWDRLSLAIALNHVATEKFEFLAIALRLLDLV